MQGSIDGGGEHFEGWFLCDENGEVFNISSESSYTFLMADDTYEPNFAEYSGLTIEQAMHLEINEIAEQIAGAGVTTSFEIKAVSLDSIKDFVISGVFQDAEHVVWLPTSMQDEPLVATYLGKIIYAENQGGIWSRLNTSNGVQSLIDENVTFGQLLPWTSGGPKVTDYVVDGTRLTLNDAISPDDVPRSALQKIGVLPKYIVDYQ